MIGSICKEVEEIVDSGLICLIIHLLGYSVLGCANHITCIVHRQVLLVYSKNCKIRNSVKFSINPDPKLSGLRPETVKL